MNVFSDLHHAGLYSSLSYLFEKRLKASLYRPIGMDWWNEGYWDVFHHNDTAKQFLLDGYYSKDGTPPLNSNSKIINGIHHIYEGSQNCTHKAITLEQFKEMKFDVILASIPAHIEPFKKLIREYQPQAKFIFQMGNRFNEIDRYIKNGTIQNLLASTIEFSVPSSLNACWYHQEFNLNIFNPTTIQPEKLITSFVNLLPQTGKSYLYYILKQELSEYEFKSYGILTDDGIISGIEKIASIMKRSMFGIHLKSGSDGFGHIVHNFFSCGIPLIINYEEYKKELAGKLLIPDETCFCVDTEDDIKRTVDKIRNLSSTQFDWMKQRVYNKFKEVVDFDKEEKEIIIPWLNKLL